MKVQKGTEIEIDKPDTFNIEKLANEWGFLPKARISFKSDHDDARAWSLVADYPTVGLPNRGMVADLRQLLKLRDVGIPVYPWTPEGETPRYDTQFDIDAFIAMVIKNRSTLEHKHGQSIVRPKRVRHS